MSVTRHIFILQTGRPPTYEEYYAMMSRSHTPPPPWSDSTTNPASNIQARRELLASQPEFREYLTQLALSERGSQYQYQQQRQQSRDAISIPREQQVRVQQRTRAMPPRWVVKETCCSKGRPRVSYLVAGIARSSQNNSRSFWGGHTRLWHRRELRWLWDVPGYRETFRSAESYQQVQSDLEKWSRQRLCKYGALLAFSSL